MLMYKDGEPLRDLRTYYAKGGGSQSVEVRRAAGEQRRPAGCVGLHFCCWVLHGTCLLAAGAVGTLFGGGWSKDCLVPASVPSLPQIVCCISTACLPATCPAAPHRSASQRTA
jgi:hypothetical protein